MYTYIHVQYNMYTCSLNSWESNHRDDPVGRDNNTLCT